MSDIRIFIKDLKGRSFQITVNVSDTIEEGKRKYKNVSGCNCDPQWTFCASILNNQKTFDFYGIEDGDTIISKMTGIRIYIQDLKCRSFQITVNGSDTIKEGKIKYKNVSGDVNDDPQWKFDGCVLNNQKTFDFYGIEDDDIIYSNNLRLG